jgi:hypothetical protein
VALFDHRRELRQETPVGFATGHARELGAEGQVRLPTRSDLSEERRELGVTRETGGAQRGRAAGLVSRQGLAQEGHRLSILRLGERSEPARIELALARAAPDEDRRGFSQRRAKSGA